MLYHEICDEAQHGCMEEATHLRSQWPQSREETVDSPLSPSSTCLPCDLTSLLRLTLPNSADSGGQAFTQGAVGTVKILVTLWLLVCEDVEFSVSGFHVQLAE